MRMRIPRQLNEQKGFKIPGEPNSAPASVQFLLKASSETADEVGLSGPELHLALYYLGCLHQKRLHCGMNKQEKIWPTWLLHLFSPGLNLLKCLSFVFLAYWVHLSVLSHNKSSNNRLWHLCFLQLWVASFFLQTTLFASECGASSQSHKCCSATNGLFLCFICTSVCLLVLTVSMNFTCCRVCSWIME